MPQCARLKIVLCATRIVLQCGVARKIISVSNDPTLLKLRTLVLQRSGHEVIGVLNYHELRQALERASCDLVVVGFTIPAAEKRRIFRMVKSYSADCPVIELFLTSPEIQDADAHILNSDGPEALLSAVAALLGESVGGSAEATL